MDSNKITGVSRWIATAAFALVTALQADMASANPRNKPPKDTSPKNIITLESGFYWLNKDKQDLQALGSGNTSSPLPIEFDSSQDVVGIDYERRMSFGVRLGGRYMSVRHPYNVPSLSPSDGMLRAEYIFATVKKYFNESQDVQPFVGAGIGEVSGSLTGRITRRLSSNTAQVVLVGVRYQPGRIGAVAEYRYIRATDIKLSSPGINQAGDVHGELDLSGHGFFLGASVRF